jgi:hypothetical protein
MAIPIIFFHFKNPPYLKYSLKQAACFNPESVIYLLGDETNDHYPVISHVMAKQYEKDTEDFASVYEHLSANGFQYELNCFLRWFYIRAFCRERKIEEFIYLDSDVLLFQNVSELTPYFRAFHIANTSAHTGVPAFTYFKNYAALDSFCNYLMYAYTNAHAKKETARLYEIFLAQTASIDGISDMTLFHLYFRDHPTETGKIDLINNELAIDVNISESNGYETRRGLKNIHWQNGLPYCKQLITGQLIRFISLHYQGDRKYLLIRHFKAGGYHLRRFPDGAKYAFKKAKKMVKKLFLKP